MEILRGTVAGGGKATKPSFVSYVTPEEIKSETPNTPKKEKHPDLLPGEVVFCSAGTVVKETQDELSQRGVFGTLLCTNFRVSFVSDEETSEDASQLFRNKLYGADDIPLSCVDHIYGGYEDKRKLISTGSLAKNKCPSKLIFHCKDLRVFTFVLTYSEEKDAKRIFQGIVHHCLEPKSLKNLFAFSYCENTACPEKQRKQRTLMFDCPEDWAADMKRSRGLCRLVTQNSSFELSPHLPQFFIVPTNVTEADMCQFQGKGLPMWCWSHHSGCALFKTSSLAVLPEDTVAQAYMEKMLTAVAHNYLFSVKTEDLCDTLPALQDVQMAYSKFKHFFLIDNTTDFWVSDMKWLSSLDSCGWLDTIRQCLQKAVEVVECLETENTNVLITEESGSDLCCIISSLVQLMLDPFYRTVPGFQSLVQKEWVAGGHNFLDRCNQLHLKENENMSPVFLLFLECVWQLLHQYGSSFQFSETYLTVLSDSLHVPVFSTFLFNTHHHRATALRAESPRSQRGPLNPPTVWDWSVQFDCRAQELFLNPLYTEKPKQDKTLAKTRPKGHQRQLSLPSACRTPPKTKGFFKDEADSLKKMLRVKRLSRWMLSPETPHPSSATRGFYEAWQRRRGTPPDPHGLLLPCLDGPRVGVWMQRYLRWIQEVQIFGGGAVTVLGKVQELQGEVRRLQRRLEERHPSSSSSSSCPSSSSSSSSSSIRARSGVGEADGRSSVRLSSSFPFTTLRNNWSYKPAIPTSVLQSLMASGSLLADREDTAEPNEPNEPNEPESVV